jgi:tetratricopeptide (TPR) repeat protein
LNLAFLRRRLTRRRFDAALVRADAARDSRRFGEAAAAYRDAFALDPRRLDLRVQRANMLKDNGDFALAEEEYLIALAAEPANADIHLQLGHLRSQLGRRTEATANYRRALDLDPELESASRAMVLAGDLSAQNSDFEALRRAQGQSALATMSFRLAALADEVARMRERLPDMAAFSAYPVDAYADYRALFDNPPPPEDEGPSEAIAIGIIVQADEETLEDLHRLIAALTDQSHANWRLLAIGRDPDRQDILRRAGARDLRFVWREAAEGSDPILTEAEAAADLETDLVLVLARGALPHRHALAWIGAVRAQTGCAAMVFDEETDGRGAVGGPLQPLFRQTVDSDTLSAANIYGLSVAVAASALRAAPKPPPGESRAFARSLLLLYLAARGSIAHVPLPLFRTPHDGPPITAETAGAHRRALAQVLGPQIAVEASPWSPWVSVTRAPLSRPEAPIAVIIPTRDNLGDLWPLLEGFVAKAKRPGALEIIILNNGAPGIIKAKPEKLGAQAAFRVIEMPEPFNWSRFNNLAVQATQAPYLVFANDDMSLLSAAWDDVVRQYLERADVGALGAKLLYPDETIQHAGVLFGWRNSLVHDGVHRAADDAGPALRWITPRAAGAVTGAFLATRRADFIAVGGFDEAHLAVAYNDVDYALKLRSRGLMILWTPAIVLHHFESKSRGLAHLNTALLARDNTERESLRKRWGQGLDVDPSINPHWRDVALPHQFMASPTLDHIWSHILRSADSNPWRVPAPD